ncbi:hypothetical protein WJX73_001846 [Symbiochloris irregularis]|uniref:RWD domain-containing protein n=1 Tax=Symbiochloris irregularis TaxID=706552 RepID=A0AAW1Q0Q1_9CHLO
MEILDEECLALEAIYGENFSRVAEDRVRVVVEPLEPGEQAALYLEFVIATDYPESCPTFDLANVNNAGLLAAAKAELIEGLTEQGNQLMGESMLYTLAEWAREHLPSTAPAAASDQPSSSQEPETSQIAPTEQEESLKGLTKAQKRRHFDKFGAAASKPRGWDWVDIISHLSKGPPDAAR